MDSVICKAWIKAQKVTTMNLRCMTNIYCRLILILVALVVLNACGQGGSEPSQTNDPQNSATASSHHDDDDDDDRGGRGGRGDRDGHGDGDDHGDGGGDPGPGPVSSVNYIAVHNPNSSQYDDNCLNCHGDIPNGQSLDSAIPNAHVAMLPFTPGENSAQCVWCHRDVSNTLIHTAAQVGAFQVNIRKTVDTQLCAICHGPVGPGKPFYQAGLTTTSELDGSQLYHHLCASCHRELSNSEVEGESAREIYQKINENEGGMGPLSVLNPIWIQAITVALGGDPTLPADIPAPGTGASLYQQYCSACHGPLASSAKVGATAAQIQNGINNVADMNSLNFLTTTQVQLIADALSGSTGGGGTGGGGAGGTDGLTLYTANCASCHGPLASSSKAGASASQIQNAINNDTGGMGVLSGLASTQVQAIADALSGGGGGGGAGGGGLPASHTDDKDGALHAPGKDTPYSSGCTACHGTTLLGDLGPSCFSCHDQKWSEDPPSSGTGGGGTGGTTDGATLYIANCSSCHGPLASSSQSGASASQIQNAINSDRGGMGVLSALTSTQIQAIADALSGSTGGGGGGGGTGGSDGTALYQSYCASCHRDISDSQVRRESASEIREAIEKDKGGMSSLEFLTTDQIDAIADALNSDS
jgi:mono/diheme cytochrome c family protein